MMKFYNMQELLNTIKNATNVVLHNNDALFEMKIPTYSAFGKVFQLIVFILFAIFLANAFIQFDVLELFTQFNLFALNEYFSIERFALLLVVLLFFPYSLLMEYLRIEYVKIDSMQIQTKSGFDLLLHRDGKTSFISSSSIIEIFSKGRGKSKRVQLIYSDLSGEKQKRVFYAQKFGNEALEKLVQWVSSKNN